MTVCFFGIYDEEYSRNKVLISGFKKNGWQVVSCRVDPRQYKGISKFYQLYREFKKIQKQDIDFVLVAFPGQTVVWLAKILFRKKIVFDMFLSLYDSNVSDRKMYKGYSARGVRDFVLDWYSAKLADKILLDTSEHIKYIAKQFKIGEPKFIRVFVGADEKTLFPVKNKKDDGNFVVHFHGSFIPLQGIIYIIEAAKILSNHKEIVFNIIGNGQERNRIEGILEEAPLKNVNLINSQSLETIASFINASDLCLGIFGNTDKAERVIPNKVYEAVACGKPIITARTKAIEELFIDGENIILCKKADPADLVKKILAVKNGIINGERIGSNARVLFERKLTAKDIVKELLLKI